MVGDGNGGDNYTYTFVPDSTGVITAEALTIMAVTNTKVYDGTTSAAGVPLITSGSLQGSDTANFMETYDTRNVGVGLILTPSGTVNDGNGGDNYTYTFLPDVTGSITPAALTITAVDNTKVYDGTMSAAGVPMITLGSLGTGDAANFIETYSTPNVGTGLTLTPSGTVSDGNDGDNYTYTFVPVSTGVITAEALTITAVTNTKGYDATTSAGTLPEITSGSLQGSDTANFSETYSTANVGTGLTLTPSGTVADGNDGNNYTYTFVPVSTGVITAEALTITAVTNTKGYDATTSAAAVPEITSGSLQGEDVADFSEAYSSANVGTGLTLTPSGMVGDGNGGDNYTYTFVPDSTGVITAEALTIMAVTNTKVYDGTTSAAGVPTVSGLQGSDTASNLSETYDTPNVGTGKTLLVASYTINDGNGGNNYTVTTVANYTGVILPVPSVPTSLVIHTQPSATATAGQIFATQPVIYVLDQNGKLLSGDNTTQVTVSLRVGNGPLLGTTTVTVSGGIATFTNLQDNKAETIVLLFTAPTVVKAQSNATTVDPAAASRLSITAPSTATAGRPFTLTVTAFDPYSNVASGYLGTIHFTSSDNRASLPGNYTFVSGDGGAHTFGNAVTLRSSGAQTITAYDVFHPSIIGSTGVSVGSGTAPAVHANGGDGGSALSQAREAVSPRALRSKARVALAAVRHPATATAGRARPITQADVARDRVLAELGEGLRAYLMAERLVGRRLD